MRHLAGTAVVLMLLGLNAFAGEFEDDVQFAAEEVQKILPDSEKLMNAGDYTGAIEKILAVFPADKRTAAESFTLGNILFDLDAKDSYLLHQAAANGQPENPNVIWEWGMEQHRAKEYAGALAAYQLFSKSRPQSAVPYALAADCLLRLNRVDEAVTAWHKSETAPNGTLETMEDLVCAVNREPAPYKRRADLLTKATKQHDAQAAVEVIALDCDFPRDWWNAGPNVAYLANDLPAVTKALKVPANDLRARSIACAGECATADGESPDAVSGILAKYKLLVDPEVTLPSDGLLLSVILVAVAESKAIDESVLRQKVGPKILALARKGHDKDLWNAAAFTADETEKDARRKLEREGWKSAADVRFASGVLFVKLGEGTLKSDDADLKAALKQFPESGEIQRAAYEVAKGEHHVTRALLVDASRAEFHRFSSFVAFATIVKRPRSNYLREYFAQLQKLPAAVIPEKK